MPTHRRAVAALSAAGALVVLAYAAVIVLQVWVLNPLAAVPGLSLSEIYARLDAAGQSPNVPAAIVPLVAVVGLAVGNGVLFRRSPVVTPGFVAAVYLGFVVLGAPIYFYTSFDMGTSLADTFQISGGDYSPWALPLYAVSALALLGLLALGVAHVVRLARRRSVPA